MLENETCYKTGRVSTHDFTVVKKLSVRQEMKTVIKKPPDEIMSKDIFVQWWTTVIDCQWQKFA